jgi:hypothetical protein
MEERRGSGGYPKRDKRRERQGRKSRDGGRRWWYFRQHYWRMSLQLNRHWSLAFSVLTEILHPCLVRPFRVRTPPPAQYRVPVPVHPSVVDLVGFYQPAVVVLQIRASRVHPDGRRRRRSRARRRERRRGSQRGCATRRSGARARARQSPAGAMRERGFGGWWWWRTSRRCHWRTYAARKRTELAELAGDPARLPADEGEKEEEVLHRHCGEVLVLVCGGQRKAERDGGGDLRNKKSRRGGSL